MPNNDTGEYFVRVLNTLFNPFESDRIVWPSGYSKAQRTLWHAGALVAGFGGIGLLARKLLQAKRDAEYAKSMDEMRSYVNARYPAWSPDPSLRDAPEEERQRSVGVQPTEEYPELAKTAEVDPADDTGLRISKLFPKGFLQSLIDPRTDPGHLAFASAAALAGGMGGWALASYIEGRNRQAELARQVRETGNEADKLIYDEYLRTRGMGTEMTPEQGEKLATQLLEKIAAEVDADVLEKLADDDFRRGLAEEQRQKPFLPTSVEEGVHGLETLYWVYALAAFALAYRGMKTYSEDQDPARRRLRQVQELSKEKARMADAPVMLDYRSLPQPPAGSPKTVDNANLLGGAKPVGSVNLPDAAKLAVVRRKRLPASSPAPTPERPPTADITDPYADLLKA